MFVAIFGWMAVLWGTLFLYGSIKRIYYGNYSLLHLATVVFFVMQILPLGFELVFGIDESMSVYYKMYDAMLDEDTALIYCLLVSLNVFVIYFLGNHLVKRQRNIKSIKNAIFSIHLGGIAKFVLYIVMFVIPIIAVFAAPDWKIYTQFTYFYTNTYSKTSIEYLYHTSVITNVTYLSFGATMLQYLYKDHDGKKRRNTDIYLAIFLFSWIDGKRALITFALIGILAIDILKQTYSNSMNKYIAKVGLFAFIAILYFVYYGSYTGKGSDASFWLQYETYYSRLSAMKTSIFDLINGHIMLDYSGETLLYDLFFFIPRTLWNTKPVMFCKYFTAYVMGRSTTNFVTWNLQVNIWTEFIANFGLLGNFLAIIVSYFIAKITEKTNSILVFLFGTLFLLFYYMFGFETLTMISYLLWIICLAMTWIHEGINHKRIRG